MKIFNSTAKTMLATAIITAGAYVAGGGTKAMMNKCDRLAEQNDSLRTELFNRDLKILDQGHKIDSLKQDAFELSIEAAKLRKIKAGYEFKPELDSLNKYGSKNLGTDFYERIINNAAALDDCSYPFTHMKQVMYKIPDGEYMNIHNASHKRCDASRNATEFFTHNPTELEN